MAHDPTRHWPLGVGPKNTSIPGAAWLELLDGQAFPVVGAGAMVWNGAMWVPVSTQNRLPVEAALSGSTMDLRGLAADRPAANSVGIGVTYWSVDTGVVEVSDGTKWVVI